MAATFSDLATIAKDANFQGRVQYALIVAAVNVYSELTSTTGHPLRTAMSARVFTQNYSIQTISLMVLQNATIAAEANVLTTPGFAVPDADIQFAINSLWNALSGV
jgi:hypothetical protein